MSRFFIDRPIFAIVVSVVIVLLGTLAGFSLPIAQYPQIQKPQIRVSTTYVGASATTVEEAVAQAIEQNVNGVENMRDMRSTSTNTGCYSLDVTFNLGKNADIGSVEVQNRVSQASPSLPSEVTSYGVTTAKQSSETIMYFALTSPNNTYDSMFLKSYALTNFVDAVKRVKGVSDVTAYGPEYSMRVNLRPDKMAQLGLTASEVSTAIKAQNIQAPVGSIGSRPTQNEQESYYTASAQGRLRTPEEFGNIIIKVIDGEPLKLKDVASISEGERMDSPLGEMDGGASVIFPVSLTTDANSIECVNQIRQVLKEAESRFPADMKLVVVHDNTEYIKESLTKVAHTFVEALVLVLFVVYIFLGNWRATMVPMLAVPVSLIGTFGSFVLLGFTINTLSLFAMILAIGLVVDDAIVVVEAVEHHIQETGLSPKEATYRAMKEVSGPVVAIAFVLAAVFIPVSFTGGSTGQLYKQFALTISVSMGLSAFVALSLTPALCALLLKPQKSVTATDGSKSKNPINRLIYYFNVWFNKTLGRYTNQVGICIRHARVMVVGLLVICIMIGVVAKITPTGYVPDEDQGMFMISYQLPEGASSNRSIHMMEKLAQEIKNLPGVEHTMSVSGNDLLVNAPKASSGMVGVMMKPFDQRSNSVQSLIPRVFGMAKEYPEMNIMAFNAAALPGLSSTGSLGMYVMNLGGDSVDQMNEYAQAFVKKAREHKELGTVYTTFSTDTPAYKFTVNREKAESLNVPVSSVYTTLQTFLGGSEVNDFNAFGRTWKVVMQADKSFRGDVRNMNLFFVKSSDGNMIPLDALVTSDFNLSVPTVTRFNGASAFKVAGSPAAGYSTGECMTILEQVAKEVLPTTYTTEWVDQSRDERDAGSSSNRIYIISLVFVFLVLAALYESWTIPIAVILSIPPAILGCFASQYFRGQQNDVYMQVAMIMLMGLGAKNAILIVEYAKMNLENGQDVVSAAKNAAHLRLRPILMTSFAFILGCFPLAIATGAGAGSRVSMGNAVVGGMTFSTFVGIFLIPVMFVVVERLFSRKKKHPDYPEEDELSEPQEEQ